MNIRAAEKRKSKAAMSGEEEKAVDNGKKPIQKNATGHSSGGDMLLSRSKKARILFIASNPTEIKFNFAEELYAIEQATRMSNGAFEVIARWSVSIEGLKRQLDEVKPDVVHLLSPGVDPERNELVLSDEAGRPQMVKAEAFAKVFAGRRALAPRLVLLNTCHSLPHATAVASHVGCAIGMTDVIYDHTAIGFAAAFYQALAEGASVAAAFEKAKLAVARITPEQAGVPSLIGGAAIPTRSKSHRQTGV